MQVHIDRGGQRFGPYTIEQVNAHLADGSLLPSDLGWTDGMADWVPVTQVSGVSTAEAAAPPPPLAAAGSSTCPKCQAEVTADQVVCMGCGTNLQSGETPAFQTAAKPAGNRKLLIGIGATVGVLALAGVGYFVIYPMVAGDGSTQEPTDIVEGEPKAPVPGGPGFGPGMGQPPGGGFAGGQGGGPQGGFGGQGRPQGGFGGQGRPQGGGQQGSFGGKGRPQGGIDPSTGLPVGGGGLGGQGGRPQGGFGGKGRPQGGGQKGSFGGKGRPKKPNQGGGVPQGQP